MTHMTPITYYKEQCQLGHVTHDDEQLKALLPLETIYHDLVKIEKQRKRLFFSLRKSKPVKGLYLWGGVGIGKTFLIDCFFHCLPFQEKKRMHFHQFMQWVHASLKTHQGKKDPLSLIAKEFARNTLVLCLDEFIVTDITDAMILARLLRALFLEGTCLITTSNAKPDDLYKNGLQRSQFLPAIALLKQHTNVIHMTTSIDYRLRYLQAAGVFYMPSDDVAHQKMETSFATLTQGQDISYDPLLIHGRSIIVEKQTDDVVWFDFDVICSVPRSQLDYLSIADQFKIIFLSNIPSIPSHAKDRISLFIRLIDVLYDARIRLIFSSAVSIPDIYKEGYLLNDFMRTRSRLLEMQSEAYYA